jgi:hypothetical protein
LIGREIDSGETAIGYHEQNKYNSGKDKQNRWRFRNLWPPTW